MERSIYLNDPSDRTNGDSMKQVTIISGKGGTGKTSVTAAFASLADNAVLADCDVDAADLHLICKPKIKKTMGFHGIKVARIDTETCTSCKICLSHCQFNAIDQAIEVHSSSCEGCGVCAHVCPVDAIEMKDRDSGFSYLSDTRFGPLSHAVLHTGEEASGKLVTQVREQAITLAKEKEKEVIIIDGPPGIGCPVISSITGVDLVVIVTEPTLSAIHDLKRIIDVAHHFHIQAVVCINKVDINEENTHMIKTYCDTHNITIVGMLPYDTMVTDAMVKEKSIIEFSDGSFSDKIRGMWEHITEILER
jgi:MinD superfamily P-loop ATPase